MESFFALYVLNQIGFNSFPYFISPFSPKTLFTFPLLITFGQLCEVPPLPIDLGLEINSFLIRDLKRKNPNVLGF